MSNLKVRPKQVDFSKMDVDYARAEITTRVPVEKMKKELDEMVTYKPGTNIADRLKAWGN